MALTLWGYWQTYMFLCLVDIMLVDDYFKAFQSGNTQHGVINYHWLQAMVSGLIIRSFRRATEWRAWPHQLALNSVEGYFCIMYRSPHLLLEASKWDTDILITIPCSQKPSDCISKYSFLCYIMCTPKTYYGYKVIQCNFPGLTKVDIRQGLFGCLFNHTQYPTGCLLMIIDTMPIWCTGRNLYKFMHPYHVPVCGYG